MDVSGRIKGKRLSEDVQVISYFLCDVMIKHYTKTASWDQIVGAGVVQCEAPSMTADQTDILTVSGGFFTVKQIKQ